MVRALDDVAGGLQHEDRLGHGVEDLAESVGCLEGPGILDGGTCPRRKVLGDRQVAWPEDPTALGTGERDRAEHAPGRHHRRGHPGTHLQTLDEREVVVVARRRREHRLVDLREQHRLARPGDGVRADGRVGIERISVTELLDEAHPFRIAVSDRDRRERAVRLEHVDGAPVGQAGNDDLRDLAQRRTAVERGAQQATGPHGQLGQGVVLIRVRLRRPGGTRRRDGRDLVDRRVDGRMHDRGRPPTGQSPRPSPIGLDARAQTRGPTCRVHYGEDCGTVALGLAMLART